MSEALAYIEGTFNWSLSPTVVVVDEEAIPEEEKLLTNAVQTSAVFISSHSSPSPDSIPMEPVLPPPPPPPETTQSPEHTES